MSETGKLRGSANTVKTATANATYSGLGGTSIVGNSEPSFIKDVNMITQYNRFRLQGYNNEAPVKGIPYVFFTTPLCNMTSQAVYADSFLTYMSQFHPDVLSTLQYKGYSQNQVEKGIWDTTSPFIKLLSNTAMSFESKDYISRTREVGETFQGFKLTMPASNVDSINGEEFAIQFRDLRDIPVLKLINSWFIYHNGVRVGKFPPSLDAIRNHYYDYMSSVYYFLTDMDGETLIYWCKYTGCAPINVPFSVFGTDWGSHDIIQYSVNFSCSFKEDMNPDILMDFNKVSMGKAKGINFKDKNEETEQGVFINDPNNLEALWVNQNQYTENGRNNVLVVMNQKEAGAIATNASDGKPRFKLLFLNQ